MREILLNAIIHKNYDSFNPIQISVYNDKIYIFNTARFSENLMSEELLYKKHSSYPHNPLIANTFFRAGLIENWAEALKNNNDVTNVTNFNKTSANNTTDNIDAIILKLISNNTD